MKETVLKLFQRTRFIIKPEIQLKYLFIVVILVVFTNACIYYFITLRIKSSPILDNLTHLEFAIIKDSIFHSILFVSLIIVVIIILTGIIFLHRLTGPLYAIERVMKQISSGDLTTSLKLRKTDELQSFAEEFQNMVNKLNLYLSEDKSRITEAQLFLNEILQNISTMSSSELKLKLVKVQEILSNIFTKLKIHSISQNVRIHE